MSEPNDHFRFLCSRFLTGSSDGFVRLWKTSSDYKQIQSLFSIPVTGFVNGLEFARNGERLVRWQHHLTQVISHTARRCPFLQLIGILSSRFDRRCPFLGMGLLKKGRLLVRGIVRIGRRIAGGSRLLLRRAKMTVSGKADYAELLNISASTATTGSLSSRSSQ